MVIVTSPLILNERGKAFQNCSPITEKKYMLFFLLADYYKIRTLILLTLFSALMQTKFLNIDNPYFV